MTDNQETNLEEKVEPETQETQVETSGENKEGAKTPPVDQNVIEKNRAFAALRQREKEVETLKAEKVALARDKSIITLLVKANLPLDMVEFITANEEEAIKEQIEKLGTYIDTNKPETTEATKTKTIEPPKDTPPVNQKPRHINDILQSIKK